MVVRDQDYYDLHRRFLVVDSWCRAMNLKSL